MDFKYYISRDTFQDEFIKSESTRTNLLRLGLQLVDVTDEEFTRAISLQERYTELSLFDTFALTIAKTRGWALLTGDMPLRKAATKERVEVHGTIWVYDQLKAQGKMPEDEYKTVINELIEAVKTGRRRLPIAGLIERKRV